MSNEPGKPAVFDKFMGYQDPDDPNVDTSSWPGNRPEYDGESRKSCRQRIRYAYGMNAVRSFDAAFQGQKRRFKTEAKTMRAMRQIPRWFPVPQSQSPVVSEPPAVLGVGEAGPLGSPAFPTKENKLLDSVVSPEIPKLEEFNLDEIDLSIDGAEDKQDGGVFVSSGNSADTSGDRGRSRSDDRGDGRDSDRSGEILSPFAAGMAAAELAGGGGKKTKNAPPFSRIIERAEVLNITVLKRLAKLANRGPEQPADLWPNLPDSKDIVEDVMWCYNEYSNIVEEDSGGVAEVWWQAARVPPPSRGAVTQMKALALDRKSYMGSTGVMSRVLLKLEGGEGEQVKAEKKSIQQIKDLLERMRDDEISR